MWGWGGVGWGGGRGRHQLRTPPGRCSLRAGHYAQLPGNRKHARTTAVPRPNSGVSGVGSRRRPGAGRYVPPSIAASCWDSSCWHSELARATSVLDAGNMAERSTSGATGRCLQQKDE